MVKKREDEAPSHSARHDSVSYNTPMELLRSIIFLSGALFIIVLAARQMGDVFFRYKLPLISGFLFVGVITGPFILDFVHTEDLPKFLLLDELALAFIAFAAGAELEVRVIRGYFRSIVSLIGGQIIAVYAIGLGAFMTIRSMVPFMADLPGGEILAISLLGSTIMIARSPSSALAIIKELRARGPFTHKVLGATVLMDAVVIVIFAASISISAVLIEGTGFNAGLLAFVGLEILVDIVLGVLVGLALRAILSLPFKNSRWFKGSLILAVGLGVFWLSNELHGVHLFGLPIGLFSEPLLICMTAGLYVANYTRQSADFQHIIESMSPGVFLLFFTLVGIELELNVIGENWLVLLILFAARAVGIIAGSVAGTALTRDRSRENLYLGLGFITQAGVSVGLAKEIGVEFGGWGPELATLSISVIVLSQVVGPPLLKWAITQVGEAHTRAESPAFDGVRDALIFGIEGQSLALARQLQKHDWNVLMVECKPELIEQAQGRSLRVEELRGISRAELERLGMAAADGVVLMLSDEENYAICELIYEHFGIDNVIVRLQDRVHLEKFHELGALVIEPVTAMVSLLDQFVRSPMAASMLLGMDSEEEFMEIEMNNPDLNGIAVRDLHLPHDVLILSVSRTGSRLISHGYTRLKLGDHVTVVGSPDSLSVVEVRFSP